MNTDDELFSFLLENTKNATFPLSGTKFCEDFRQKTGCPLRTDTLWKRVLRIVANVHEMSGLSTNEKVKILFALGRQVDPGFLKELRKAAVVELDEMNRITNYKSYSLTLDSLAPKREPTRVATPRTRRSSAVYQEELSDLFDFIAQKAQNIVFPLNVTQLCHEYQKRNDIPTKTLNTRIRAKRHNIHEMTKFNVETRVKMLFGLRARVDEEFLKELRKTASVDVDTERRIIKYNGKFVLIGDMSLSAKGGATPKKVKNEVPSSDEEDDVMLRRSGRTPSRPPPPTPQFSYRPMTNNDPSPAVRRKLSAPASVVPSRSPLRTPAYQADSDDDDNMSVVTTRSGRTPSKRHLTPDFLYDQSSSSSRKSPRVHPRSAPSILKKTIKPEPIHDSDDDDNMSMMTRRSGRTPSKAHLPPDFLYDQGSHSSNSILRTPIKRPSPLATRVSDILIPRIPRNRSELNTSRPRAPQIPRNTVSLTQNSNEKTPENPARALMIGRRNLELGDSSLISTTDHIRFLESINTVIFTMDLPILKELQVRIHKNLEKFRAHGNKNLKLTFNELRASILSCILIISKSMTVDKPMKEGEASTSLKEFLLIFRTSMAGLKFPILEKCDLKLKLMIGELSAQDQPFPIEKLAFVLRVVVEFVAP